MKSFCFVNEVVLCEAALQPQINDTCQSMCFILADNKHEKKLFLRYGQNAQANIIFFWDSFGLIRIKHLFINNQLFNYND